MKLTNKQIEEYIAELPDNIRSAITEFNWAGEIMSIGKDHQIQIDDIEIFRHETVKVMLGIESAESYQSNLVKEMDISKDLAITLVEEANNRIFHELQKRAFQSKDTTDEENGPHYVDHQDPYLEPIEHHELRNVMKDEGVDLLDHDEPMQVETFSKKNEQFLSRKEREINENTSAQPNINSYQEPIDENDLRGIRTQEIDTSILKEQHQSQPEHIFHSSEKSTDIVLKNNNQDLEKHNYNNEYIAKKVAVNASPNESELIKEEGTFLTELSKTEEK